MGTDISYDIKSLRVSEILGIWAEEIHAIFMFIFELRYYSVRSTIIRMSKSSSYMMQTTQEMPERFNNFTLDMHVKRNHYDHSIPNWSEFTTNFWGLTCLLYGSAPTGEHVRNSTGRIRQKFEFDLSLQFLIDLQLNGQREKCSHLYVVTFGNSRRKT